MKMYSMVFKANDTTSHMELILTNGRKARKPMFVYLNRDTENHSVFKVSHVAPFLGVQEYNEHYCENGWNNSSGNESYKYGG
jgi:hypothetical protein